MEWPESCFFCGRHNKESNRLFGERHRFVCEKCLVEFSIVKSEGPTSDPGMGTGESSAEEKGHEPPTALLKVFDLRGKYTFVSKIRELMAQGVKEKLESERPVAGGIEDGGDAAARKDNKAAFDEEARAVMARACAEAKKMGVSYVGTEHLLLGILKTVNGRVAGILKRAGIRISRVRGEVKNENDKGR